MALSARQLRWPQSTVLPLGVGAAFSKLDVAWVGHACVECNRPATFDYAWWSLLGDFRMLFHFVTGTIAYELEKSEHGDERER